MRDYFEERRIEELNKKWTECKAYYERMYAKELALRKLPINLKRPSDQDVEQLYRDMKRLEDQIYFARK